MRIGGEGIGAVEKIADRQPRKVRQFQGLTGNESTLKFVGACELTTWIIVLLRPNVLAKSPQNGLNGRKLATVDVPSPQFVAGMIFT